MCRGCALPFPISAMVALPALSEPESKYYSLLSSCVDPIRQLIDWSAVSRLLDFDSQSTVTSNSDCDFNALQNECIASCRHIQRLAIVVHNIFCETRIVELPTTSQTGYKYLEIASLWQSNPEECSGFAFAQVASYVERFLGEIFIAIMRARGQVSYVVPRMIKDLLQPEGEIARVLPPVLLTLLDILIGNPNALNLRNLLWHGFLLPQCLPQAYTSLLCLCYRSLLVTAHVIMCSERHASMCHTGNSDCKESVCCVVSCLFPLNPPRPLLSLLEFDAGLSLDPEQSLPSLMESINVILQPSNFLTGEQTDELKRWFGVLQSSQCCSTSTCLESRSLFRWDWFMAILIPMIEQGLRRKWVQFNRLNTKYASASNTHLYFTIDSLLADTVPIDPLEDEDIRRRSQLTNQLRTQLGNDICAVLDDLFIYRDGIRLRDRLAHAETALRLISLNVVTLLLAATAILIKLPLETEHTTDSNSQSLALLQYQVVFSAVLQCKPYSWIADYHSCFAAEAVWLRLLVTNMAHLDLFCCLIYHACNAHVNSSFVSEVFYVVPENNSFIFTDVLPHAYLHHKLCDAMIGDIAMFEKAGCTSAPDLWLHFKISNLEFPVSIESLLSPNITRGPESDWPKLAAAVRDFRLENESTNKVTAGENSEIIYTMQRIQLHMNTVLQRITTRLFIVGNAVFGLRFKSMQFLLELVKCLPAGVHTNTTISEVSFDNSFKQPSNRTLRAFDQLQSFVSPFSVLLTLILTICKYLFITICVNPDISNSEVTNATQACSTVDTHLSDLHSCHSLKPGLKLLSRIETLLQRVDSLLRDGEIARAIGLLVELHSDHITVFWKVR